MSKPKFKRLPNGFGAIVHLKGKRRKPWNARTPQMGLSETACPITFSLGCYETWLAAYDAICEWHKKNDTLMAAKPKVSLQECYDKAMERAMNKTPLADNTVLSYETSFRLWGDLRERPIGSIDARQIQARLDQAVGRSAAQIMLVTLRKAVRYALRNDFLDRDITQGVEVATRAKTSVEDKFFTMDELAVLKRAAAAGDAQAKMLLVMCYSGFRPAAYETIEIKDGCFFGGIKTEDSKRRYVPIYPEVAPWIDEAVGKEYLAIKKAMGECLARLGLRKLSPHATRHTFRYLCYLGKVDSVVSRKLMGHKAGDIHDRIYAHADIADLAVEIKKLPW